MTSTRLPWLGVAAAGVLAACGSSPPTRFYALSEVAPATPANSAATPGLMPLRLEPVAIPGELDRLELVTHEDANRLHIANTDRWAAPLDEQIRRTLSEDLSARLAPQSIADPNEPSTGEARRRLSVEIAELDASADCSVRLRASWTLRSTPTQTRSGSEQIDVPGSAPCPANLAAVMSRALAGFADRLAPILQSAN